MSRSPRHSALAALSGVLLLSLVGTACGGGNGEDKPAKKDAKPPALKERWDLEADGVMALWQYGKTVALTHETSGETTLTGHAADSGRKKWSFALPDGATEICAASQKANSGGWGLLGLKKKGGDCSILATVDMRNGTLGWQKPLTGKRHEALNNSKLTIGEKVAAIGKTCVTALRFGLDDGTELPSVAKDDKNCPGLATHDESVTALLRYADDGREKADLELYDTDSGRHLWRRQVDEDGKPQILTNDPLTLATREDGKTVIQTFDADGKPTPVVDSSAGKIAVVAVGEGVLVMLEKDTLRAYDLREGKELWSRKESGHFTPKFVQRDGIVSIRKVRQKDDSRSIWVTRHDLRNPDKQEMLGAIPVDAEPVRVLQWDEQNLRVLAHAGNDGSYVATYALPDKGSTYAYRGTADNEIAVQGPDVLDR